MAVDSPDNLKKNIIEGQMVEVNLPSGIKRVEEIEALPYVKDCTVHGALLHVLLDEKDDLNKLQNDLGCIAKWITPSLEDVFISLARKQRMEDLQKI
jgi:ABC-2 type transport system ATP-binding protein